MHTATSQQVSQFVSLCWMCIYLWRPLGNVSFDQYRKEEIAQETPRHVCESCLFQLIQSVWFFPNLSSKQIKEEQIDLSVYVCICYMPNHAQPGDILPNSELSTGLWKPSAWKDTKCTHVPLHKCGVIKPVLLLMRYRKWFAAPPEQRLGYSSKHF